MKEARDIGQATGGHPIDFPGKRTSFRETLAIPGAIGQFALATLAGTALALPWGWTLGASLVLGLSLSVASTVVMLKALEERNGVSTTNGRVAVGWLIVEDLAMVLVAKSVIAALLVLGYPVGTALTVSAALAQVGEFSFILGGLGVTSVRAASISPPAVSSGKWRSSANNRGRRTSPPWTTAKCGR